MAWSDSYRRLPHFEIVFRERSQRTISDLVCGHAGQSIVRLKTRPTLSCTRAFHRRGTLDCHCVQNKGWYQTYTHTVRVTHRLQSKRGGIVGAKLKENKWKTTSLKAVLWFNFHLACDWNRVFWKTLEGGFQFKALVHYSHLYPPSRPWL